MGERFEVGESWACRRSVIGPSGVWQEFRRIAAPYDSDIAKPLTCRDFPIRFCVTELPVENPCRLVGSYCDALATAAPKI